VAEEGKPKGVVACSAGVRILDASAEGGGKEKKIRERSPTAFYTGWERGSRVRRAISHPSWEKKKKVDKERKSLFLPAVVNREVPTTGEERKKEKELLYQK